MNDQDFCHLHVHTTRSLLDGYTRIPDLVDVVKGYGQRSVAITEHGTLGSLPELFREAKRVGIKPIAGLEAYLCEDRLVRGGGKDKRVPYFHITILAQNLAGYANLCKLSDLSYFEGFYSKPRIDMNALEAHAEGLILLSGCVGGWPQQLILKGEEPEALKWCMQAKDIMQGRFLLESQHTGEPDQLIVNKKFLEWTKKHNFKHVLTGDSHYTRKEDGPDHDVLLCIGLGKPLTDENRIKFKPGQYAVKSVAEMAKLGFPESSLKNSKYVSDMCELYELPRAGGFPQHKNAYEVLEAAAMDGLADRAGLPEDATTEYWDRMLYELEVIKKLGFEDYFLIAHEITAYARQNHMYWTWGRGSSVGSLVAYALGITNIDPVLHHLYFERFLNSERKNPPDIDIDFTDEDRPRIIEFIEKKYGSDNVAHIATFSSLGTRQVLIDLCKVLGKDEAKLKFVLNSLPHDHTLKISDVLADPNNVNGITKYLGAEVVDYMYKFEGIARHASIHAAGVIIDRESLVGKIPMLMPRAKMVKASQYVYDDLVSLGYEKFDILGVRALRTIRDASRMAKVDLQSIPLDDPKAYGILSNGLTVGVFQLEGWGYRQFLQEFKPKNFEDVMMVNALYRPGPMAGGKGLGELIARRKRQKAVTYAHPSLESILKPTFGVMVYQEQVMAVVRTLAGWTLAEADQLRYAVGKKKVEMLAGLKDKFIADCIASGHTEQFSLDMFAEIEFFGRYGWNKAHAAAYGMVTYVAAYLKANFPHEYMCCMLNCEEGDPKHRGLLVVECARMGIKVARPHVNNSTDKFQVIPDVRGKFILPGLSCIKYLGSKGVEAITTARNNKDRFSSIENFVERVPPRLCNSLARTHLKQAHAFDGLPETEALVEVPF